MANDGFAAPTRGEKFYIHRKRNSWSQRVAAKKYKLPLNTIILGEKDAPDVKVPVISIGRLEAGERCVLQRRRAGYTQKRVAKELKMCRYWVNQMENGTVDCTPLTSYWNA
jgi:DNA-binding XRE family transcriptional regulator